VLFYHYNTFYIVDLFGVYQTLMPKFVGFTSATKREIIIWKTVLLTKSPKYVPRTDLS